MAETTSGSSHRRHSARHPRLGGATWSFSQAWEVAERRGPGAFLVVGRRPGMARTRWFAAQVPFLPSQEEAPA
jgi:hypothetical protein